MKVVQLGKYYYPDRGGVETYTQTVAEGLAEKLIQNEVIVNNKDRSKKVDFVNKIKVTRLRKLVEFFHAPIAPFPFAYLKKQKFDVIHLHLPNPWLELNALIYFMVCGKKERVIVTYHADIPHYTLFHKIIDAFRASFAIPLLGYADKIIATSPTYVPGSLLLKRFSKKVVVVPTGIDTKKYEVQGKNVLLTKRKYGLENKRIILFEGRLFPYKGLDYLLEAFSLLKEKREQIVLVIAGGGELHNKLLEKSKVLGIEKDVIFTGFVDDQTRNSLYYLSDVFVLPSINRGEAFGISLLEAMYHKKPLITTNIKDSGVTFVNLNKRTGLVVEPKDSKALYMAMDYLLTNTKLARRFGLNGYRRLLENFTKENFVKKLVDLYEDTNNL